MYLYDGNSDIDWFYEGKKTREEMSSDPKYDELLNNVVVLYDDGHGKVYRYELASSYALKHGEVLDPINPQKTIDKIIQKADGIYVDPYELISQVMMRSDFSDNEARDYASFYPEWKVNTSYKQGWIIKYRDNIYKIVQDHISQAQWVPGTSGTESLYSSLTISEDGTQIWKQPTGAHDCYNSGDVVIYKKKKYKSLINGNVWSPDAYPTGWELYTGDSSDTETPAKPDTGDDSGSSTSYPNFVQPTGAHDAYNTGDIVEYKGTLYKSLIDGNAWAPDVYPAGWEKYTEE